MDKTKQLVLGPKVKATYQNIDERYKLMGMTGEFIRFHNHQCPGCEKDFKFNGNVIDNIKALSMTIIFREGIYEPYVLCKDCYYITKKADIAAQEVFKVIEDKMRTYFLDEDGLTEHRKGKIDRIAKNEGYENLEEYLNEAKKVKGMNELEKWKFGFLSTFFVNYVNDKFISIENFELKKIIKITNLETSFIEKKYGLCEIELAGGLHIKITLDNFGNMQFLGLNDNSKKALKEHGLATPLK